LVVPEPRAQGAADHVRDLETFAEIKERHPIRPTQLPGHGSSNETSGLADSHLRDDAVSQTHSHPPGLPGRAAAGSFYARIRARLSGLRIAKLDPEED